jgi:hypothetical protein
MFPKALAPVAHQAAGRRICTTTILESDFAAHRNRVVTLGLLYSAPVAAGEVMDDLHRLNSKLVEIVHDDVRPGPSTRVPRFLNPAT